ncbi:MAG: hypothetical protein GWN53_17160 [Gammaproteobacteria bacterium]|uniref:Uncharacterized protein n=1 Tax=Candidatus Kutchimonas denitrificans TaxID=3056748 RepID=A0AAE4ZB31_9BACT|nr:hypothetical protein [Candidatus Kutchimonas denitrificans]NIV53571.1 hypothetical protein [Gammaproteobacteria bacterium]
MSGGSLNYVYQDVERVADTIQRRADTPLQRAFAQHLNRVATALHDLEWVWSCDYAPGDEVEAILAVLHPDERVEAEYKRCADLMEALLDFHRDRQLLRPK